MSLLGTEIAELREMNRLMVAGELSTKQCNARLKIYKATLERQRMILDCHKLATLKGITLGHLEQTGIIGKGEIIPAIDVNRDDETLDCPEQDKIITRGECLDYSGDTENMEDCSSCRNFSTTRRELL